LAVWQLGGGRGVVADRRAGGRRLPAAGNLRAGRRACYNSLVRYRPLSGVIAAAVFSTVVSAHFVLIQPAASLIQNRLGDPQKIWPCGGVSANPARGTPGNAGVP